MLEQINDILQNTVITPYTATVKLLISFLLGAVIGIERPVSYTHLRAHET